MTKKLASLVSTADIADMANVKYTSVVSNWIARYEDFPKPVMVVARGEIKLWQRSEIKKWLRSKS